MAATPATAFGANMLKLTTNLGGAIESLPQSNQVGGKSRFFVEVINLAAQAAGTVFAVSRVPLPAALLGIRALTSVSLGTATLQFGDAGNGNSAIYGAAATLTAVNAPTNWAVAATYGQPILNGYDCLTGAQVLYNAPGSGGAGYEDIIMTTGVAALPGAGTLVILTEYMID